MIVIPGDARVIGKLPSGNWEVTEAWIYERARYEAELEAKLRACEGTE